MAGRHILPGAGFGGGGGGGGVPVVETEIGRWRNTWSAAPTDGLGPYAEGDLVVYAGSTYRANTTPAPTVVPNGSTEWSVLAQGGIPGPPGPPGPPGAAGATGPAGSGTAGSSLRHVQTAAASVWTVTHAFSAYPQVLVLDATGQQLHAELQYPDDQKVVIVHGQPYSGTAYLRS